MPTIRIPLAAPYQNRDLATALGNVTTDSFNINCYVETQKDGRKLVVKRPGLLPVYTYNSGGATNGQGLFVYKGITYAVGSNVLYRLTGSGNGSADGTAWTASTSGPFLARFNFGCIVFQGQIIVAGGANAGGTQFLNDVWSSSDGVNWTQLVSAAPWAKRRSPSLAILGNTLYLIGGDGAALYADVWSTTDGVNWTQVVSSAPWGGRFGAAVVAFNQGIFLMGGLTATAYSNDVWFSPDGATWTQMVTTAGWGIRAYHSALVFGGKIWIAGGTNGIVQTDVWSSPDGLTWTNTGNLPAAREEMATCVYAGKMWFITGADIAVTGTTTVWSSTNGAAFTVVTAAYGGGARLGSMAVVFATPTATSAINAPTMWLIAGGGAGITNAIYTATLNVALPSSISIGTSAPNTTPFQTATQNAGAYLILKTTTDAWVYYTGQLQQITSTNYPKLTVPGIVNLDDTIYVMDADGVIYGSNLSDPFTWSALNFITADFDSDTAVALVKYQNYVLAIKAYTIQFFYDAGRYPGSPLLPAITYNLKVGCVSAESVAVLQNTVVWAAQSQSGGYYIAVMEGTTPVRISSTAIDKILQDWVPSTLDHSGPKTELGHVWYYLSMHSLGITIAYDFIEKEWCIWKNSTNAFFVGINETSDGTNPLMQDYAIGAVYIPSPTTYLDNATTITSIIQTIKVDGGNNKRKFTGGLTAIGNRRGASPNNLLIQWSDDDALTFNTGVTVDLTTARPRISRTGSFRRRVWKCTHTANQAFQLEALEQEIVGNG